MSTVDKLARHHGVEAFVNMSQMTVSQMSITETTDSKQQKLHWLAEQALSWSGLPVVTVRPTVFLESLFLLFAAASVREADALALPMGNGKTSPISAANVARAVSVILDDPVPHIGHVYNLTGFESANLDHYARVFSKDRRVGNRPNSRLPFSAHPRNRGAVGSLGAMWAPAMKSGDRLN